MTHEDRERLRCNLARQVYGPGSPCTDDPVIDALNFAIATIAELRARVTPATTEDHRRHELARIQGEAECLRRDLSAARVERDRLQQMVGELTSERDRVRREQDRREACGPSVILENGKVTVEGAKT